MIRYLFVLMTIIVSPGIFAQGKLYVIPQAGFYSGSYSGVDSVNSKQNFLSSRKFLGKDFIAGIKLSYLLDDWGFSLGVEQGKYSSGFHHYDDRSKFPYVVSKETLSQGSVIVAFTELKRELLSIDVLKPKWLAKKSNPDKPYLVVSRLAPFVGFEYRRLGSTFINDFPEGSSIGTIDGDIPGMNWYHSYRRNQFSMRAGVDWVFYDSDKRRFIFSVLYHFAFEDAGYFRYHFSKPGVADFYYQNNTRGNGFAIYAGIPIKLFDFKKNRADN